MAETSNIAEIARKVSEEIFEILKWQRINLNDKNWDCIDTDKHDNKTTHPTDAMFHYLDPYTGKRIYINTDLKSFARKSIQKTQIVKDLVSLAQAIDCANKSKEWFDTFAYLNQERYDVAGMLLIHNHDNNYDKDFKEVMSQINNKNLHITDNQKIFVLGPDNINYLISITNDIATLVFKKIICDLTDLTFYYPDLMSRRRHDRNNIKHAATLESITSNWLILKSESKNKETYIIYYRGNGSTVKEFEYLIDSLSFFQLLSGENEIKIRLYQSDSKAVLNFNKAKNEYLKAWNLNHGDKNLDFLSATNINSVIKEFSTFELGIQDE